MCWKEHTEASPREVEKNPEKTHDLSGMVAELELNQVSHLREQMPSPLDCAAFQHLVGNQN